VIFTYGYTTKKDGQGYGLHSCASYIKEMNGEIDFQSEGQGKGTTFSLKFPIPHKS
jgi:sensor histidine kinase regulating citrate/malate metabolism